MNIAILKNAWQSSSLVSRAAFIAGTAVLVLIAVSAGATGWEHLRADRFDKRQKETERQLDDMDAQIDLLTVRAQKAEAKGELMEQKAEALQALSTKQNERVQAEARKVDDAFTQYQKDQSITGMDVASDTRRERICEKRKELGYPCAVE